MFLKNHKAIMSLYKFLHSSTGKGWYMMSNITDGFIVLNTLFLMLPRLSEVIFAVRQNLIYVGLLYDFILVTNQKMLWKLCGIYHRKFR